MKKALTIISILTFLVSGCSTKYLQNATNVSQTKKEYSKILVVAKSQDKTARINFEDQVVNDLNTHGINANSSMHLIKSDSFGKELTEKELNNLRNRIKSEGFDGVLITNIIDVSQYTDVDPGSVGTTYVPTRYGRFGRYYGYYPVSYWGADQVKVGVKYTLESCLYDLRIEELDNLHWVGRFQIKDPKNLTKTIIKYSEELTGALLEQSINN